MTPHGLLIFNKLNQEKIPESVIQNTGEKMKKCLSVFLTLVLVLLVRGPFTGAVSAAIDPDLMIITPLEYSAALEPLMHHKNATGMSTAMVTLEGIYSQFGGDDEPEQIKKAIKYYYDSYDIKYVMLVGDCNKFPIRWQRGHFNDDLLDDDDNDNDDILYTTNDTRY